ncbi:MAG: helix-turn-helix domain-containing protein [Chloroflexi bacterium]|nr:helix-turn-helix domain-containing protein [Chloroflexota bacterium]
MRTTAREDLERELDEPEFRRLYGAAEAKSELAVALANARHELRLTQEEISKKVGVSQPYIAKLEGGEANPTIGAIGSILAILNLRLAMKTVPLLPRLSSSGSADMSIVDTSFLYKPAADTSGVAPMTLEATFVQREIKQTRTLFPTENYNPFRPIPEVSESFLVTVPGHQFEEVNVGGQRA